MTSLDVLGFIIVCVLMYKFMGNIQHVIYCKLQSYALMISNN